MSATPVPAWFAVTEQRADKAQRLAVLIMASAAAPPQHHSVNTAEATPRGSIGLAQPDPPISPSRELTSRTTALRDQRFSDLPHCCAIYRPHREWPLCAYGCPSHRDARSAGIGLLHLRFEHPVGGQRHGRWHLVMPSFFAIGTASSSVTLRNIDRYAHAPQAFFLSPCPARRQNHQ